MYNPTITLADFHATIGLEHKSLCEEYKICTSAECKEVILESLDVSRLKALRNFLDTFFLPEEQTVLEAYVDAIGHYEDACDFIASEATLGPDDPWLSGIFELISVLHDMIGDFRFNDFKIPEEN